MKRYRTVAALSACLLVLAIYLFRIEAAAPTTFQRFEYATIRWRGENETHLVRPNGQVEFLGSLLSKIQRPDKVETRAFYMNIALNAVAREGFELVAMTSDEMVLKRPIGESPLVP